MADNSSCQAHFVMPRHGLVRLPGDTGLVSQIILRATFGNICMLWLRLYASYHHASRHVQYLRIFKKKSGNRGKLYVATFGDKCGEFYGTGPSSPRQPETFMHGVIMAALWQPSIRCCTWWGPLQLWTRGHLANSLCSIIFTFCRHCQYAL